MSFLNRFQSKISTVTSNGNFEHVASGKQQVRTGVARRPKKTTGRPKSNQGEKPTPRKTVVNEAKEDKLAFSKKARPVSYKPYKLSDYKRENQDTYFELGKLQPDLNDEELVAKRANKERIKAFSQNLREINRQQKAPQAKKSPVPETSEPSAREKALAFSKKVPKPKATRSAAEKPKVIRSGGGKQAPVSNLEMLESKHRSIQSKVDAIRRDMAQQL